MASFWGGGNNLTTDNSISKQRQIAAALMNQGMDASPVGHWTQALARALQGGLGGYQMSQADAADAKLTRQRELEAATEKAKAEAEKRNTPDYQWFSGEGMFNMNPYMAGPNGPLQVSRATQKRDELTAYQRAQLERQQKLDDWRMKVTDNKAKAQPKFTEGQTKDAGWADRMATAEGNIATATNPASPDATRPNRWLNKIWSDDDNLMNSKGWQLYKQAKTEWIMALLRKDTGAAISQQEYEDADRTYFPQPGESDEVAQAKALSRKRVQESLAAGSGGAYDYFNQQRQGGGAPPMDGPALDNRYQSMSDEDILRELGQ